MALSDSFQYEIGESENDQFGNKVTTIKCHGRLVVENSSVVDEMVKPLMPLSGRIIIDLGDLTYLDSSGLGALIKLKVTAMKNGYCRVELANMTPRVLELLRITNLMQWFAS